MIEENLIQSLRRIIRKECGDKDVALAFSGGLDSALIGFITKDYASVQAYVVGTDKDVHDVRTAEDAAKMLGLPLKKIFVDENDILAAARELKSFNLSLLGTSYHLPLYFVAKSSVSDGHSLVLSGQGADELFGGYARYMRMKTEEFAEAHRKDSIQLKNGVKVDEKICKGFGVGVLFPYLEDEFFRTALEVPPELKINGRIRKYILRRMALAAGLPEGIAYRDKKAAQYGSGIWKVMKSLHRKGFV